MKPPPASEKLKIAYDILWKNYSAIEDFRAKLLALLPTVSAGGIFFLMKNDADSPLKNYSLPIGLFGLLVTLGLFAYELFGIKKCHATLIAAKDAEAELGITGPFASRPQELWWLINEPFASGIIYPAVLAAWTFVAFCILWPALSMYVASAVFVIGFGVSLAYNYHLKRDAMNRNGLMEANRQILVAEEAGDSTALSKLLHSEFYNRNAYLKDVPTYKGRGRSADQFTIHFFERYAVFTCRVTTTLDAERKPSIERSWDTRLFIEEQKKWQCIRWQKMEINSLTETVVRTPSPSL